MSNEVIFWLLAALSTFVVGAAKGGLPGVGILSVPILAQVTSPGVAAGLLLPLYIVSDIYGLWLYRKSYNARVIKITVGAAIVGILIGWATARFNNDSLVRLIVGLVGLWYIADLVWKKFRQMPAEPRPADIPRGLFWCTIAGFTSFVAHAGGTPYQMYVLPQRMSKMVFAGTGTIAFTFINLLKVPPYIQLGQINWGSLGQGIYLAPVALVGAWAGYHATRILPEKLFFTCVQIALFCVSVKLIYDSSTWWMGLL